MKQLLLTFLLIWNVSVFAQNSGALVVGGELDKYYPVVWTDGGWTNNTASQLEVGRAVVHTDGQWRGSIVATFNYHTTRWGNGSGFIDANIYQSGNPAEPDQQGFVGGWIDATDNNSTFDVIIWLKGGGTTYYYKSEYPVSYHVYDGVQNALPFQETGGTAYTLKTTVDSYVNFNGLSKAGSAYFNGGTGNYFAGNVGIGITSPNEKLAVNGNIRAKEIKVENANWPDYVFAKSYALPSLQETEKQIQETGHLLGIPSATEVKANGVDLGEINAKLLQKIEELTLHLIEMSKQNEIRDKKFKMEIDMLKSKLK